MEQEVIEQSEFVQVSRWGYWIAENGELVKQNPLKFPYSYDPFVLYRAIGYAEMDVKSMFCEYSDRLLTRDWDKHNTLCMKHFGDEGQSWSEREPSHIQAFLRDYLEAPDLVLTMIIQSCNVSNGYPVWAFRFLCSSLQNE